MIKRMVSVVVNMSALLRKCVLKIAEMTTTCLDVSQIMTLEIIDSSRESFRTGLSSFDQFFYATP